MRGLFFIYRRQDLFIYIGIFSVPLPPGCLPTGAVGAGAFGRKEGGACRLSGVSGASIIRKSKCSTDFKRNDFLKKNEAYPLGALRSLKFAYRKLRISLFVELAV